MKHGIIPILHIDHECFYVSLIVQYALRLVYFSIGSFIVAFLGGYDIFFPFSPFHSVHQKGFYDFINFSKKARHTCTLEGSERWVSDDPDWVLFKHHSLTIKLHKIIYMSMSAYKRK